MRPLERGTDETLYIACRTVGIVKDITWEDIREHIEKELEVMTQGELAKAMGVSQGAVSRVANGACCGIHNAIKIITYLF